MTTNSTPTYHHSHTRARRRRPACLQTQHRPAQLALTPGLTLVHGHGAAVSVAVDQRVLCPASLVRTHAAASDHFPHAVLFPYEQMRSPLRTTAQTRAAARQVVLPNLTAEPRIVQWHAPRGNKNLDEGGKKKIRCFYVFCVMSSSMQCACAQLIPPGRESKVKTKAAKFRINRFF